MMWPSLGSGLSRKTWRLTLASGRASRVACPTGTRLLLGDVPVWKSTCSGIVSVLANTTCGGGGGGGGRWLVGGGPRAAGPCRHACLAAGGARPLQRRTSTATLCVGSRLVTTMQLLR